MDDGLQFRRIVVECRFAHDLHHAVGFVVQLFEPKLVSLMDDDEQHLVVRRCVVLVALGGLCAQDFIKLKIIVIVNGHLFSGSR